jgi:replication-associated recombination protein RarA
MNAFSEYTETVNVPWVEKYRPTDFKDVILSDTNKSIFNTILETGKFPNILFYGPPGTGKTTTIINLIKSYLKKFFSYKKDLIIHLNASDDRGIEMIRTQLSSFVASSNMFSTGYKFIILDEVDYMTKTAQQSLRHIISRNNKNIRYCLICNYITKVNIDLRYEFVIMRFNAMPKDQIVSLLKNICKQENVSFTNEWLNEIQRTFGVDIRQMINYIQSKQYKTVYSFDKHQECIRYIMSEPEFDLCLKFVHKFNTKMELSDIEFIEKSIPILYSVIFTPDDVCKLQQYSDMISDLKNILHTEFNSIYSIHYFIFIVKKYTSIDVTNV